MSKKKSAPLASIVKRDGTQAPFTAEKISAAIEKAMRASGEYRDGAPQLVTDGVIHALEREVALDRKFVPTVEAVQDIVEQQLVFKKFPATAKAYILYREKHAEMRAFVTASSLGLVDNYLSELDWQVKENSNMGYSLQGMNNYIFSEVSKTYWVGKGYPQN